MDGLPGLPGGDGGSFFGIFDTTAEGQNLRISSNGGRGGDGQDGVDGLISEGVISPLNKEEYLPGQGGRGGRGGIHGILELLSLDNSITSNIEISAANGADGKNGINGSIIERNDYHYYTVIIFQPMKKVEMKLYQPYWRIASVLVDILMNDLYITNQHTYDKSIGMDDFILAVIKYRKNLILNTLKTGTISYAQFYKKLNNNLHLVKILNGSVFLAELFDLEYSYYSLELNKSIIMSIGWNQGMTLYKSDQKYMKETNDYKILLSKLQDMTSRKVEDFQNNFHDIPILKIDIYLRQSIEDSKKLRNVEVINKLTEIGNEFKKDFEKEIEEAGKLVDEGLIVYLEKRIDDLNIEIERLVKEIDEMIESKRNSINNLEEIRKQIIGTLVLRSIFTVLQLILKGITFINPVCAVIGTAASSVLSVIEENVLDSNDDTTYLYVKLPEAATRSFKGDIAAYNTKLEDDKLFVKNKLKEIKTRMIDINLVGDEALPLINVDKRVKDTCLSTSDPRNCMKRILKSEYKKWTKIDASKQTIYAKALNIMNGATNTLDVVQLVVDRVNKIAKDVSRLGQVNEMIEKEKNDIKKLEEFKDKIHEELEPQIEQIRMGLREATNGFAISSRAFLEYQTFLMNDYLMGVSSNLQSLTKQFRVADDVTETMTKVKNAVNAIIRMHTHIKDLRFRIKNAEYFQSVATAPFQVDNIRDPKLSQILTKLEQIHYANDIIKDYNKLVIAMQRYTYPLTRQYAYFTTNPNAFFDSSLTVASIIIEKMKHLESDLQKRRGHGTIIEAVMHSKFGNGGRNPPFYIWNNSMHSSAIKDIFGGKEVDLFANIFNDEKNFSAVKYRDIGILFTFPEFSEELKNDLSQFLVMLKHNGDSYYRCLDKVHLIESGATYWTPNFLESRRKRHDCGNDYVLSPFATWSIRLVPIYPSSNFTSLAKHVNGVNIELVGNGQFMVPNATICNNLMNVYGKEVSFIA